ncbi:MAG TPA: MG2 domain-containing protein [Acidobacteriota bacterium]|nr:MG2 domain-containing protein [Acidobacteriota bacterium]
MTNDQDQVLAYVARTPFTATFHCQRENPQADCVPIATMHLEFSAQVPWTIVQKAVLKGPGGREWHPDAPGRNEGDDTRSVSYLTFKAPFPERSTFVLEIPPAIVDDAGRNLSNAGGFPLTVRTDEYPPLAKFAADFGILEAKSNPLLPVTLRNVEPEVAGRMFEVPGGEENMDPVQVDINERVAANIQGRILRIPPDKASQIIAWIEKVKRRGWDDRDKSIFGSVTLPKTRKFTIPKLQGKKSFEVVGIPVKAPGFYVVEIESEILGAALLGNPKPMYVPTTALVTNLAVHFKWGIDQSLVWVTTLDKATPVDQANIQIRDCEGKVRAEGKTDRNGVARFQSLPDQQSLPRCSAMRQQEGLLVTAQLSDDMAFVHSSWNEGIEPWRFQLPFEWQPHLTAAHTILDRSLFRAGETVHMKHILRRHVTAGFSLEPASENPDSLVIQHLGSDQRYEQQLKWDANGIAESTWTIPKEARLGEYEILLSGGNKTPSDAGSTNHSGGTISGSFRVEEYRVPLMRALIRPPSQPLVSPSDVPVDLTVTYLGGGAAGNLPIKFRYDIHPRYVPGFEGFEDYTFSNGAVKEGLVRGEPEEEESQTLKLKSTDLTLDKLGSARTTITGLQKIDKPEEILAELEFKDPNSEIVTSSSRISLWSAERLIGIRPDSWALSKDALKFRVAVVSLTGKPVASAPVRVDLFERKTYSHRTRLVGGFYAYEHSTEIKRLQTFCEGKTDKRGLLLCEKPSPVSGQVILQATTRDESGRETTTFQDSWVAGKDEWWFAARDDDRIDLLPEKKRYEPGDRARFQVRMPFRKATALVTIEREGVGEAFLRELSGKEPVVDIPVKGQYAPNVFVSIFVVRGRLSGVQPTATVDLGRPAYKLGIAEINVGWGSHELKVRVQPERTVYKVREKARVSIAVAAGDGKAPPRGAEVAVAAVDEGLLELMPNSSWNLLESMMGRRNYGVQTSTAQMHVIGKRHFGLKALPPGGGGGRQTTRELFDTLLLWKGRVSLDEDGRATVEVPLNDSLTSFRIVAVANAGLDLFGTGSASIRSTQDLMIFSGISPVVRQGDKYRSEFTLRNASERRMDVLVALRIREFAELPSPQTIALAPGESKQIGWSITAPLGVDSLKYELEASAGDVVLDRLNVVQKVVPAVPVRTFQATLAQLDGDLRMDVERPKDSLPSLGGIRISFKRSLVDGLTGVADYMKIYPYICLEQLVSKAVALRDMALWGRVMSQLPSYLDGDGLAKYFPSMRLGSDVLTSYVVSIASEAGWEIPAEAKQRMLAGLRGFVEGRVVRWSSLPTADVGIRKLSAVEALSREAKVEPGLLSTITIEPNLWPTSAVVDWLNILRRTSAIRNRDDRLRETDQVLRARLNFQGTTMGFSTERNDMLWWLMCSVDANAVRLILSQMEAPAWREDIPRLVRGALGRQHRGHWDTTVANAWGVLAMDKFSRTFEGTPVTGTTTAALAGKTQAVEWKNSPNRDELSFGWPAQRSPLTLHMAGSGKPWATVQSLAAIPLREPFSSGFRIKKTYVPVEQKEQGVWSQGDIVRVKLELESQADMTWVVVSDPIPAGAAIFGTGLGRDSSLATRGEKREGWVWPAFEERSFEAFRSYYDYVPKGTWTIEYTIRLNSAGQMNLPPTRVEAMYAPEMFGELPNSPIQIKQ